jgi:membrane protease YdiL (CAAX protease family)
VRSSSIGSTQIVSQRPDAPLPAHFSTLVWRIACTKIIVLSTLFLLLRLEGKGFNELGLNAREWPKHLGVGLLFGLVMFVALNVSLGSVMSSLLPRTAASGPSILTFFKEPGKPAGLVADRDLRWGVVEELQRIFIFTRFEKWLGRPGLVLGFALSSVMFGLGHRYQGLGIAISTAVSGVLFALVYLRRRSALEPITAHAFSDGLAMLGATMQAR